jgi:catechol 2,3-dioxygenase-like lactoylglutathione lyase family enzyme
MSLRASAICHVVIHVKDLDRSERFYREVLGFEGRAASVAEDGQRRVFLRFSLAEGNGNDHDIALFEIAGDAKGNEGMDHMALFVDAADLDEVEAELAQRGVSASERSQLDSVFISDPDGFVIELLPKSAQVALQERVARREAADLYV